MTLYDAMLERHSVRQYTDKKIEPEKIEILKNKIDEINKKSGLDISLCTEEPEAFQANKPSYGSFSGCKNYFVLAAGKGRDEDIGYYGEELVLLSQTIGLNTCWVALTFEKNKVPVKLSENEKIYDVIALGYGKTQGVAHKSKPLDKLYRAKCDLPEWFMRGMEAAALAPTAINQQRFIISYENGKVGAKALLGPCSKTDLGIVKYHFELGAGSENIIWEDR
jgi:hypothetical protein